MLSAKLVQLIEEHWQQISERTVARIHKDPELLHLRQLPEADLRDMGQNIVRNLGYWLVAASWQELADRWQELGHRRHEEQLPLHEFLRGLQLLKECLLEFIRDHASPEFSVDIYAEEELELQVGRFFDCLVYHMVKGYEMGVPRAAHV